MFDVARDTLEAMTEAARPGEPMRRIAEVFTQRLDRAGFARQRFAGCGYSLGPPSRPTRRAAAPQSHAGSALPLASWWPVPVRWWPRSPPRSRPPGSGMSTRPSTGG